MATGQGTIISDGKGNYKKLVGNDWVDYTPNDPNMGGAKKSAGGGKFSPQAQAFLNTMSQQAADAGETGRMYDQAGQYIKTLKPGPNRGRFLEIATPEENGGFMDTLGAAIVGGPARLIGAVTPEETRALQGLKRLQSEQVLGKQLLQKGPQTESDAARLQLTELSPMKDATLNQQVIEQGKKKTDRTRAKSIFYTAWANKYGLNGVAPNGLTADQVWAQSADHIANRVLGRAKTVVESRAQARSKTGAKIKILSREKVQ
jgi:hypothetical protein